MNLRELMEMKALYGMTAPMKTRVCKSYRKGRLYRAQQIFDKNGRVIKQIIHKMF